MAAPNGPRGVGCMGVLMALMLFAMGLLLLASYGYELSPEAPTAPPATQPGETVSVPEDEIRIPEGTGGEWGMEYTWEELDPIEKPSHVFNILLIGKDGGENSRSDSMILCTVNTKARTLVMTSFLRDLYVAIPGWGGHNRLNAAYALGGRELLDKALEQNFGVRVDHNIEVDFSGFESVIAVFGGVRMELTAEEAAYLGDGLTEGSNFLTPAQALRYVRLRKIGSDFGRTERQRKLLLSLMAASKELGYEQLVALKEKLEPLVEDDMSSAQMAVYMLEILPILDELTVTTQYIPAPGAFRRETVDGKDVLVPDLKANYEILRDTLT